MNSEKIVTAIRNLLDSLNEHNHDSVVNQLSQYIEYGTEESVLLGEACFNHFINNKRDLNMEQKKVYEPAICTLFRKLMEKPHFSVVFSRVVRHTLVGKDFFDNLSYALQLSGFEKLRFGFFLMDSENNDVRVAGRDFFTSCCEELRAAHNSLDTAEYIRNVPQNVLTPSVAMDSSSDFTNPSQAVNSASRHTSIGDPSPQIQELIPLMINILTSDNIQVLANYFTTIFAEQYYPWFAQYLVIRRVSVEPDLHMLYINFLEKTSSKQLNKEILSASYEFCKVVLGSASELIKSKSEAHQCLKNLGGWLGKLTIGRNQPLLAKHIDLKSLLLKAYEKGLLIGVIPFIAKIMEPCESSVAYQPPNVWTMAILGLLAEIYATENLTENLKHEIEVLFNNLKVDMTLVAQTSLLKDRSSQQQIVQNVNSSVNQDELPFADTDSFSVSQSHATLLVQSIVPRSRNNVTKYYVFLSEIVNCFYQVGSSAVNDAKEADEVINHPEASSSCCTDENRTSEASEPDFREQVSMLLAEWCHIRHCPDIKKDAVYAQYVLQLYQNVLTKADDMPDRFFHLLLELVVSEIDLSPLKFHPQKHPSPFLFIDIYADFILSILKFYPDDEGSSKLPLLLKVLAVIVESITANAMKMKASTLSYKDTLLIQKELLRPMLYRRLFIYFFVHLSTLESVVKDENSQVLKAISDSFHALRPLKVPEFRCSLLSLVGHKDFMPKLLTEDGRKGWPYFHQLLIDFFQFLEPLVRTEPLTEPVRVLYNGILKVLLVLIHDFPEFICYYHFSLCDVIGPRCIQLRNLILSASPRNMKIPDPITTTLKVDLLPEMSQPPRISSNFDAALKANNMKSDLDEYLNTKPAKSSFLSELKHKLCLSSYEAEKSGTCYNVPLMNSLVLYVGTKAIEQMHTRSNPGATTGGWCVEAALNIFQTIILDLDSEGRYYFFNAVANQLRYPNNHTCYFAFIMLYFFTEIKLETVEEQITRILLERMITKSPRPWGALVTFLELVKNPRYNFSKLTLTNYDLEII